MPAHSTKSRRKKSRTKHPKSSKRFGKQKGPSSDGPFCFYAETLRSDADLAADAGSVVTRPRFVLLHQRLHQAGVQRVFIAVVAGAGGGVAAVGGAQQGAQLVFADAAIAIDVQLAEQLIAVSAGGRGRWRWWWRAGQGLGFIQAQAAVFIAVQRGKQGRNFIAAG